MWFALVTTALANDLYDVVLTNHTAPGVDPALCEMQGDFDSLQAVTASFYVDFYVGRPAPPPLGEIGDYWVFIDPVTPRAGIFDGSSYTELPRGSSRVSGRTVFELAGVGTVYWDRTFFRINLELPDDPVSRWWDLNVNGDPGVFVSETSYSNNHAEAFTDCL
jgi:hypothetical protein